MAYFGAGEGENGGNVQNFIVFTNSGVRHIDSIMRGPVHGCLWCACRCGAVLAAPGL